ncbi:MAG TPA: hypothetical protein VF329_13520 [Gammaproteobacteria bacterium]
MRATHDNVVALPRRLPRYGEARVEPGEYVARLAGCETWARCHGWTPRCVLVWTITDAEAFGVHVPGYYRVVKLQGGPRRNGRFVIGSRSRLYRDLARMLNRRPPTDRIPLEEVTGLYSIVVRDVTTDRDSHPIGAAAYSVVDWVRGPA